MSLVSVILVTFERPARLWQALESVGMQTYDQVEVVVINNGGTSVEALIDRYQQLFRRPIQLITLRYPQRLPVARNVGIASAQGEIIAFLDDDDRYRPGHLERLHQALEQRPDAILVYDDTLILIEDTVGRDEKPHVIATCRLGLPYDQKRFEHDSYIPPSALALRRKVLEDCGGFDRHLDHVEDWELLLRIRKYGAFLYVPGEIGIEYSLRLSGDNRGSSFDQSRLACLDVLTKRYNLSPLVPKTFYDVARDLGCEVIPTEQEATIQRE
ncbi:glycosyltransferase family 2 protein [Ktedonosporobacter rubrisoli]|uniref:Glycosyltransferase family 2 protein n=1 Tax=Ktedonosporobacter rubrisoli TaxID=2509675 RepID=A0A4P6JI89_KTERU|nr:glycosyltransferase family A protein [Ktedonosporobacter rubrisoli]QBD74768.1 glycosyltransferase family 2 protein [Ktedonosporobacter rubrisoli]